LLKNEKVKTPEPIAIKKNNEVINNKKTENKQVTSSIPAIQKGKFK